jgi:hypothetical protein
MIKPLNVLWLLNSAENVVYQERRRELEQKYGIKLCLETWLAESKNYIDQNQPDGLLITALHPKNRSIPSVPNKITEQLEPSLREPFRALFHITHYASEKGLLTRVVMSQRDKAEILLLKRAIEKAGALIYVPDVNGQRANAEDYLTKIVQEIKEKR